ERLRDQRDQVLVRNARERVAEDDRAPLVHDLVQPLRFIILEFLGKDVGDEVRQVLFQDDVIAPPADVPPGVREQVGPAAVLLVEAPVLTVREAWEPEIIDDVVLEEETEGVHLALRPLLRGEAVGRDAELVVEDDDALDGRRDAPDIRPATREILQISDVYEVED